MDAVCEVAGRPEEKDGRGGCPRSVFARDDHSLWLFCRMLLKVISFGRTMSVMVAGSGETENSIKTWSSCRVRLI